MSLDSNLYSLPPWTTELRPHQEEAIEQIIALFRDRRVVMLDAPTGAGKTLIGEIVSQIVRRQYGFESSLYVCTTRTLQDQFLEDFPRAKVIKGRSNYATADEPSRFGMTGARHLDASDCTRQRITADDLPFCGTCDEQVPDSQMDLEDGSGQHCMHCHPWQACPYQLAKEAALSARTAVANTAYFLSEANYVGRFSADPPIHHLGQVCKTVPFGLVVVDEADTLESVLMSTIQIEFSPYAVRQIGKLDTRLGKGPTRVTKPEDWVEWLRGVQALALEEALAFSKWQPLPGMEPDLAKKRAFDFWSGLAMRSLEVAGSIEANPSGWVMEGREVAFTFQPVTVAPYAHQWLWSRAPRWLLMSATLVSGDQMAKDLGLAPGQWDAVTVGSGFPPERRPIKVRPVANVTHKTREEAWPLIAEEVEAILDVHSMERVLIHTVSYAFAGFLFDELSRGDHRGRLVTYERAFERERALDTYQNRTRAVLIAPSMERGVDLPDELCRVVVIAKVPFPNTSNAQVEKRLYGTPDGRSWYATETVRSIVQMSGRGMRHKDDFCVTYLLDSQFMTNVWKNELSRSKIPKWWKEAIVWEQPQKRERKERYEPEVAF